MEKPTANRREAEWLEVHEAALLLEAARKHSPGIDWGTVPIYPILATFLLTGGRKSEVLGLEVGDVSFERKTVTFRPNRYRRLKSATSHRPVPLWPQLEAILRDHLRETGRAGGLLFPSPVNGATTPEPAEGKEVSDRPITDLRRVLDKIAVKAGWAPGEIRTRRFRHTYCAARLQTLDRGAPVSPFTVQKEMGHGGRGLVDRVYGHLGTVRHRSEEVEYRPEDFEPEVGERIRAL